MSKRILDIGCGKRKIKGAIGIDIDLNADFDYFMDAHNLQFEDDYFDVVYCLDVVEHCENPYRVLSEIKRVLKRDGILYLSVPNIYRFHRLLCFWLNRRTSVDFSHLYCFDKSVMSQLLGKLGMSIIHTAYYYWHTRLIAHRNAATSILFTVRNNL